MIRLRYMNRVNRDAKFRELKEQGLNVVKTSIRAQLTHPQYIQDWEGEEKYDTGIGNTVYKTYFKVIYTVEERSGGI